jgi:hypothetical protein
VLRSIAVACLVAVVPLVGAGCGESAARPSCVPGRAVACACVDEPGQGIQTCAPDGSGFGECTACTVGPAFREVSAEARLRYLEAAPLDGVTPCAIPAYCDMNLYTGGAAIGSRSTRRNPATRGFFAIEAPSGLDGSTM